MVKFFSKPFKKNWIVYIIRLSNNKEYVITDLISKTKLILKEWDKETIAYNDYKREYIQLKILYKQYKNTNI